MTGPESDPSGRLDGPPNAASRQLPSLAVDVTAQFSDAESVFDVDVEFEVQPGETVVVLGPSGSGKSLVLETIAGFHPHEGSVALGTDDITDLSPEDRGFGFVFQDYALFPHMTVRENVAFGQQFHGTAADGDLPEPETLLSGLDVADLAERSPRTLSGGEKQRVALARSLAIRPAVMLLDEPLAGLDVPTRQALRTDLAEILTDVTAVYVTHNRTTARALADRIVVMSNGTVVQRGSPADIFERPESPMVATFTGANAIELPAAPSLRALLGGDDGLDGHVAIRPEAVSLDGTEGDLQATVERIVREDTANRVTMSFDDITVDALTDRSPSVGEAVWVTFPRDKLYTC